AYMIPAAFIAIDAIPLTTNGKVDHRALPTPGPTISTTQRYVAPRTPVEEKLAAIWSDVLCVERVGAEDNFFDLGGDSIRAVQVLSACRAAGLGLAVWMVLQAKTLSELAAMVPVGGPNGDHGDGVPLTPSQLRLIDQGASGGRTVRLALSAQPDVGLLDRSLRAVVNHHQALRLILTENGRAVEGEAGAARVVPLDLRSVPDGLRRAAIGRAVAEAGAALEPAHGALVRGTLVRVDDEKPDELWLTVHALAADEGSWPTIVADLNSAYRALVSGAPADLEPIATPWRTWAEQLAEQARSESLPDLAEYWLGRPPAAVLPLDRPDGRDNDTEATARSLTVVLPAAQTALLLAGPEPEHLLLTSLGRVLADWSGGERVEIDVASDPRRDAALGAALSRTVGPLADRHPVSLRLPKGRDLAGSVRSVGRQLRAVPSFAQAYGLLRHLAADSELAEELGRSPAPQVGFRFTPAAVTETERSSDVPLVFAPAHIAPAAAPDAPRPHLLELDAQVRDDQLYLRWTYGECVHDADTVRGLADAQLRELTSFLGQSGGRPAHSAHATHQAAASDAVTELMTLHRVPGASIALIHDGEVTSVRAFGTLGVDDPTPVTEDTLFAAGSISKHVTTFALLRLVSDGLVELDRDINDYLRSWKVPPGPEPVTAASLLANQAGLAPHPARDDYYHRYDPVPTVLDVLHGRPPAKTPPVRRRDAPGEVFKLSPLNFSVLQQAMTDLTGEPFPELVGRLLFEPLGMTASGFDSVFPDTSGRLFARGHRADGTPVPDGFVIHPETAAGGLWTTAGDLARLGLEIRRCHLGRPGGLVDAGLVRRMLTPQAGRNYGWSTILDDTGGDLEFGHGGQATGYQAMTGLRAQSGTGAVLLSNAAGGRELVRHLLATVWSGQHHLAHLWQRAIDEATARERDGHRKDAAK
ncbi:serine hydrolase, partial [Streptomyces sp. NPDC060000]|uniref:serine hydrolase domain-containing protein n=1 Tax=Streptomyces sp. NPDC060000 TaxID=3347031 RepID=UPI0036B920CA